MNVLIQDNKNLIPRFYSLSLLLTSFLIAIDPKGDWLVVHLEGVLGELKQFSLIQTSVFILLLLTSIISTLNILLKGKLIFSKELLIITIAIFSSCIIGILKGSNTFDLVIEASSFFLIPIQLTLFLNFDGTINRNLFKNCYYIIILTTLFKFIFYFLFISNSEFLFKAGALKLSTIFLCHGLGLIYCFLENKKKSYKTNLILISISLFFGVISTQKSYFFLLTIFLFYIFIKTIISKKINILPLVFIIFIFFGILLTDNSSERRYQGKVSLNNTESFLKRYDTFQCIFKETSLSDWIVGSGIGTSIDCSQERVIEKDRKNNKVLRRNQIELGLLNIFLKLGIVNMGIYVLFFNRWLNKNISKDLQISNSAKSTLFFLIAISIFKTSISSIYNLYFILILILWNLSGQNQLAKNKLLIKKF